MILNFLRSIFDKKFPQYGMGALESPIDSRNISITQVQAPVPIPAQYKTDISMLPVENQQMLGTCVGQSHMKLMQYYIYKQTGKILDLSVRAIYKWCKEIDGFSTGQGTFPSVMAKVLTKKGIPMAVYALNNNFLTHTEYLDIKIEGDGLKDASSRIVGGYAFVPLGFEFVKQAIFQNGVVTGTLDVDTNWYSGIIKKVLNIVGRHSVLWFGYDDEGVYVRNSWGNWFGKTLGKMLFSEGEFYFKWEDYKENVYDIIAYLKIPEALLQEAKGQDFKFLNDLEYGSTGYEVYKLQERLLKELKLKGLVTGNFYSQTKNLVIEYQKRNNLSPVGRVGKLTREKLNMKKSYIDEWCEITKQHEGYFVGSTSYRNKNPGNLKYVGQKGSIGKDKKGFAIFASYEDGYNALKNMLLRACTGKSSVYRPDMDLYAFYSVYAPVSDNNNSKLYAEIVAKHLGVDPKTQIKNLL